MASPNNPKTTPYNPYGPPKKTPKPLPPKTQREVLYPKNYIPSIENHIIKGGIMTTGIILSTGLVKEFKKSMAPDFTIKSGIPLFTVVILSSYLIDWLQRSEYIPYSI